MNIDKKELLEWMYKNHSNVVEEMSSSSHHYDKDNLSKYHLEGDVWTHTMGVLNACDRDDLNLVCLLHDMGKPISREEFEDKKRAMFSGHEGASFFLAPKLIFDFAKEKGISLEDNPEFMINSLISIADHGFIYTLLRNGLGQKTKNKLIDHFSGREEHFKNMLDFSVFDRKGSIAAVESEIDFKKEFAFVLEEKLLYDNFSVYDDKKPTVTLMMGLPGSGKSTYVKNNLSGQEVLSSDDLVMKLGGTDNYSENFHTVDHNEVMVAFNKRKSELVDAGKDFVIDLTSLTGRKRNNLIKQLTSKFNVRCVFMVTSLDTALKMNYKRGESGDKVIPKRVIVDMAKSLTLPNLSNVYEIEWNVRHEDNSLKYIEKNTSIPKNNLKRKKTIRP